MNLPLLLLSAALALAPAKEAELLAKRAAASFQAGHAKEALAQAIQAYKIAPLPAILLELGKYHAWNGQRSEAAAAYREYLKQRPQAPDRAWVQKRIAELEGASALDLEVVPLVQPAAPGTSQPPAASKDAQASALAADPFAETGEVQASSSHSHAPALILGAGAVVVAAFAVGGAIDVVSYNSYLSSAQQHPGSVAWDQGRSNGASVWSIVAIGGAILAAAGVTTAVVVW